MFGLRVWMYPIRLFGLGSMYKHCKSEVNMRRAKAGWSYSTWRLYVWSWAWAETLLRNTNLTIIQRHHCNPMCFSSYTLLVLLSGFHPGRWHATNSVAYRGVSCCCFTLRGLLRPRPCLIAWWWADECYLRSFESTASTPSNHSGIISCTTVFNRMP